MKLPENAVYFGDGKLSSDILALYHAGVSHFSSSLEQNYEMMFMGLLLSEISFITLKLGSRPLRGDNVPFRHDARLSDSYAAQGLGSLESLLCSPGTGLP